MRKGWSYSHEIERGFDVTDYIGVLSSSFLDRLFFPKVSLATRPYLHGTEYQLFFGSHSRFVVGFPQNNGSLISRAPRLTSDFFLSRPGFTRPRRA